MINFTLFLSKIWGFRITRAGGPLVSKVMIGRPLAAFQRYAAFTGRFQKKKFLLKLNEIVLKGSIKCTEEWKISHGQFYCEFCLIFFSARAQLMLRELQLDQADIKCTDGVLRPKSILWGQDWGYTRLNENCPQRKKLKLATIKRWLN